MKLLEYRKAGGVYFDNAAYTFPEFLTEELQDKISNAVDGNFGLRKIQKRVYVAGKIMDKDTAEVVPLLVYTLALTREYEWKTLLASEKFEYNPIENYDRGEHEEITRTQGEQETETAFGATTETVGEGAHTDTTTNTRSADNSSSYQPDSQTQTSYGAATTTNESTAHTDTTTSGERTDGEERDLNVHGNIGTVTTQDMIKEEREVAEFSAVLRIAHEIANEIGEGVL